MLRSYAVTDIGHRRQINQDFVYLSETPVGNLPNIFIVADGMGGHNAGEFASRYAVETIVEEVKASVEKNPTLILGKAIDRANAFIRQKAGSDKTLMGMGTTVVIATCIGKYLEVANVGDSRLYLINEEIEQVTIDHSLVEEMIQSGGIDRRSARNHPDKNIITRALGARGMVEADFFNLELEAGDIVLLCSDGLTNMVEDDAIRQILKSGDSLKERAEALVQRANYNGGKDNISVIIIEPSADVRYEHD